MFRFRFRKGAIVVLLFFLFFAFVSTLFPYHAFAESVEHALIPQTGNLKANYNAYPLVNYTLDTYVDTGLLKWLWDWKEGALDTFVMGIAYVVNVFFLMNVFMSMVMGAVIQEIYSMDITMDIFSKGIQTMRRMAGINEYGRFNQSGLFPEIFSLLVVSLGIWLLWKIMIQRKTASGFSGFIMAFLLFAFCILFIAKADYFISTINQFTKEIETSMFSFLGDTGNGVENIRTQLFDLTTVQPFKILQFGSLDVSDESLKQLLSLSPGSTERVNIMKKLVEDGNVMASPDGIMLRLVFYPFLGFFNFVLQAVVLAFCGIKYGYSLIMYVLVFMAPFCLVVALIPPFRKTAENFFMKLIGTSLKRVGISLLITVMFMANGFVYQLTNGGNYGFIVNMVVQIFICIIIFMKRKELFGIFGMKGGDLGRQGADFMNRGLRQMRNLELMRAVTNRRPMGQRGMAFAGAGGSSDPNLNDSPIDRSQSRTKNADPKDDKNMNLVDRMHRDEKQLKEMDEMNRASKRMLESEDLKNKLDKDGNLNLNDKNKKIVPKNESGRVDGNKVDEERQNRNLVTPVQRNIPKTNEVDKSLIDRNNRNVDPIKRKNTDPVARTTGKSVDQVEKNTPSLSSASTNYDWVNGEWKRDSKGDLPKEALQKMKPQEREQEVKAQKERQQQKQYQQQEQDIAVASEYMDSVISRNKGKNFKASNVDKMFLRKIPNGERFVDDQGEFDVVNWYRERSGLRPKVELPKNDIGKGQERTIYKPK